MVKHTYNILRYIETHPECSFDELERSIGSPCTQSAYFRDAAKQGWIYTRRINAKGEGRLILTDLGQIAIDEYRDARTRSYFYVAGSVAAILTAILKILDYCNP